MSYQINVAKILREKNSNTIDMVLCDKNDLEKSFQRICYVVKKWGGGIDRIKRGMQYDVTEN